MEHHLVDLYSTSGTFKMLLTTPGFIEETIIKQGNWEPHLADFICGNMWRGGVFIDVGANIGYHSLFVAASCSQATCISYEPHPQLAEQFHHNIRLNQWTNIKLHQAAVGNRIGTTSFNLHTNSGYNRGLSSILNYDYMHTDYKQINVPIVTLDQSIDSNVLSDVKVIKIDTQGYEYEVLQGAQQIIQASHPIVCFEYHNHPSHTLEDILNLLPNHYQLYRLYSWKGGIKPYVADDPKMHIEDLDLICIPAKTI